MVSGFSFTLTITALPSAFRRANKTNGRVIFEAMEVGDDVHVYIDMIAIRAS